MPKFMCTVEAAPLGVFEWVEQNEGLAIDPEGACVHIGVLGRQGVHGNSVRL